ncbi:MAG TPA: flagellar filament capping protein FliD [Burkholderiales bacterium]|nr:flagellar filament capping protein FliD [Burkholderiales bacterium]
MSINAFSAPVSNANGIFSQNRYNTFQPLESLSNIQSSYSTEISSISQILSSLTNLNSAALPLTNTSAFSLVSASLENPELGNAYAQSGANPGTSAITFSSLASKQTLTTASVTSADNSIGLGSPTALTFTFGSIINNQFTPDTARAPRSILIQSPDNSLNGVASRINNANIGLTASITGNAAGQSLLISGKSGAENAFSISVSGDPTMATLLSYTPGSLQGLMPLSQAGDASAKINNRTTISSNNTIINALPEVKLDLTATGQTTLTISDDSTQTKLAITNFITQYNAAQNTLNTAFSSGTLEGNSYIKSLASALSSPFSKINTGLLNSIGLSINPDGTLTLNSSQLNKALIANNKAIKLLFTSSNGQGIADQISALTYSNDSSNSSLNQISQGLAAALTGALDFETGLLGTLNNSYNWMYSQYSSLNQLLNNIASTVTFFSNSVTPQQSVPIHQKIL